MLIKTNEQNRPPYTFTVYGTWETGKNNHLKHIARDWCDTVGYAVTSYASIPQWSIVEPGSSASVPTPC